MDYVDFYNSAVNNEDFNIKEDFRRWMQARPRGSAWECGGVRGELQGGLRGGALVPSFLHDW